MVLTLADAFPFKSLNIHVILHPNLIVSVLPTFSSNFLRIILLLGFGVVAVTVGFAVGMLRMRC